MTAHELRGEVHAAIDESRARTTDTLAALARPLWPNPRVAGRQESPASAMVLQGPAEPSQGPARPGAGTRVQPVAFADVLAGRTPIIVEPEPEVVAFGGLMFDRAEFLYWPGESVPLVHRPAQVWPWTVQTPQPGDPHCPRAVSWSTWDEHTIEWSEPCSPFVWSPLVRLTIEEWDQCWDAYWRQRAADMERFAESVGAFCHARDRQASESNVNDLVTTLIELARDGQREDFDFLARSSGVDDDRREELWTGTRRRLGLV